MRTGIFVAAALAVKGWKVAVVEQVHDMRLRLNSLLHVWMIHSGTGCVLWS